MAQFFYLLQKDIKLNIHNISILMNIFIIFMIIAIQIVIKKNKNKICDLYNNIRPFYY